MSEPIRNRSLDAAASAERSSTTDPDLAAVRAAQRDPAAFAVLYHRYLDAVYSYAFYQLGDHHDAEDATARTFMAALRAIRSFRDEGASFRAWLFRIARNTIANAHRTRSRRPGLEQVFGHLALVHGGARSRWRQSRSSRRHRMPIRLAWRCAPRRPGASGRRWRPSQTIAARSSCCASPMA